MPTAPGRTGTIRTSLREFGASIMRPPPSSIATCPGRAPS